ncbi:MAG: hypothetical protein VX642_12240 [Bdellovibrionota bacterium]|nr:hypothetical protein [Bdellovibrionota bacterium]
MAVNKLKQHCNEDGFATIEALTMVFIMVGLMSFTIGSFGVVHTGIVNSIASKTYLWEMMEMRADVSYHRSNPGYDAANWNESMRRKPGFRYGGIASERNSGSDNPRFNATARNIDFRIAKDNSGRSSDSASKHSQTRNLNLNERASISVDDVWVKTTYGICLNASCGGVE